MATPSIRSLVERRIKLGLSITEVAGERLLCMVPDRLEAIERGTLQPTNAQLAGIDQALCRLENRQRRHAFTCNCPDCERTGSGDFAVRAYAGGETEPLALLSEPVASILPSLIEPFKDAA